MLVSNTFRLSNEQKQNPLFPYIKIINKSDIPNFFKSFFNFFYS